MDLALHLGLDPEDAPGSAVPPPTPGAWILATGVWNDAGAWDDTALWKDS